MQHTMSWPRLPHGALYVPPSPHTCAAKSVQTLGKTVKLKPSLSCRELPQEARSVFSVVAPGLGTSLGPFSENGEMKEGCGWFAPFCSRLVVLTQSTEQHRRPWRPSFSSGPAECLTLSLSIQFNCPMQWNFDKKANAWFYPGQGEGAVMLPASQASVQSFLVRPKIPSPSSPSLGEEKLAPKRERQGSNSFSPTT